MSFLCVRLSPSFIALSLSWARIFLPPEGRCIRASNLYFFPPNTLFTHSYYSLFLFLISISLLIHGILFLIPYCLISSPFSFLYSHLPSLSTKRRSGKTGKTSLSILKCKRVPIYSYWEKPAQCMRYSAGSKEILKESLTTLTIL